MTATLHHSLNIEEKGFRVYLLPITVGNLPRLQEPEQVSFAVGSALSLLILG